MIRYGLKKNHRKSMPACFKNSPFYLLAISIIVTLLLHPNLPAASKAPSPYLEGIKVYENFTDSDIRESIELFKKAIHEEPAFSPAYSSLAESYIQLYYRTQEKDSTLIETASTMAEKALFTDARSPMAHKAIASVYFARGKIDEAIEELERAVDMNPAYARALLNLGSCWFELGEKDKAVQFFKEAMKLNNDPLATALAHYNIACAKAAEGAHRPALESYNIALKLLPGYFNIHYGRGISLMNLSRDEEAVSAFKEATRLKPDYPAALLGLASAYHRLGDIPEARKRYEAVLGLNPDLEDAERGLAALDGKRLGCLFMY